MLCVNIWERWYLFVMFIPGLGAQLPEINSGTTITSGQLVKGYGARETRQLSSLAGEGCAISAILKDFKME